MEISELSGLQINTTNQLSLVDINNDGFNDVFVQNEDKEYLFYINQKNGKFIPQEIYGLDSSQVLQSHVWSDINHDGSKDLIAYTEPNLKIQLFINQGELNFEEDITNANLSTVSLIKSLLISDLNMDGWEDLLVFRGEIEFLFYANINGVFFDKTEEYQLSNIYNTHEGLAFDFDNDLDIDLYFLGEQSTKNIFFINNGNGIFSKLDSIGLNYEGNSLATKSIDCNNDGYSDLFLSTDNKNYIFENTGNGFYQDVSSTVGQELQHAGREILEFDFDLDGMNDILISALTTNQGVKLYKNIESQSFEEIEISIAIDSATNLFSSDLNHDGLQDLIISHSANNGISYYLNGTNHYSPTHHFIALDLINNENRSIYGTRIIAKSGDKEYHTSVGSSYQLNGFMESEIHFGLGSSSVIDQLEIYWPDGTIENIYNLTANEKYRIEKEAGYTLIENYNPPEFENRSEEIYKANVSTNSVSMADFDNDGDEDIYFGTTRNKFNYFYENLGDWEFKEIGDPTNLRNTKDGHVSAWGDFNNDGWLDLYVGTQQDRNDLFINNGKGSFTNIAESAGVDALGQPNSLSLADVNHDGFLDIYISNIIDNNILFINNGDLTFSDQTIESGVSDFSSAMGSIFFDYDNDGDSDLYLVHDVNQTNILYQNDGNGIFTDVAVDAGLDYEANGMGVDFGDFNNDGFLDVYLTNLYENVLFENNGNGKFNNIGQLSRTYDIGMSWSTLFFDYDNDGLSDLYLCNDSQFSPFSNVLYKNMGNGSFKVVSTESIVGSNNISYGGASGDFNNDGLIDLAVANRSQSSGNELYQNKNVGKNWIKFKLHGTLSNVAAIGARVKIEYGESKIQMDEISSGSGYASQNSLILHFGLSDHEKIDKITVNWPGTTIEEYFDINANTFYEIVEGQGIEIYDPNSTSSIESIEKTKFSLSTFPNPLSQMVNISFELENKSNVSLKIIGQTGELIDQVYAGILPAGKQELSWKPSSNLINGVYFGIIDIDGSIFSFNLQLSH
jgi:hypothetical protein